MCYWTLELSKSCDLCSCPAVYVMQKARRDACWDLPCSSCSCQWRTCCCCVGDVLLCADEMNCLHTCVSSQLLYTWAALISLCVGVLSQHTHKASLKGLTMTVRPSAAAFITTSTMLTCLSVSSKTTHLSAPSNSLCYIRFILFEAETLTKSNTVTFWFWTFWRTCSRNLNFCVINYAQVNSALWIFMFRSVFFSTWSRLKHVHKYLIFSGGHKLHDWNEFLEVQQKLVGCTLHPVGCCVHMLPW